MKNNVLKNCKYYLKHKHFINEKQTDLISIFFLFIIKEDFY